MKDEWIQKVSRAAGGATQHARHPSTSGTFYLSKGRNFSGVNYEAEIPAGLHISCGFAPSMASQTSFGELSLARSGLSVLSSQEPIRLRTAVSSGEFRSAGLSIDWQTLADHDLPACLAAIPDNVCMGVERIPPRIVAALVAPIHEWFQGTARDLAIEGRSLALFAVLEQCLATSSETLESSRSLSLANAAREIVDVEFAGTLTIHSLAARLKCSPRTLTSAFRQSFGTTIGAYLTDCRLAAAASLLRSGYGATQTAYRVGYTPAHFATAFKRQFGVSPREWSGGAAQSRKPLPLTESPRR